MSLFTPSTLTLQLAEHIRAAFSGLYVLTHEPDEALAEIRRLCIDERWNLATWDVLSGLSVASGPSTAVGDPLAAVNALAGMAGPDETTLLVLRNFHRYIGGAEVVQALEQQLVLGQALRTFVVILAPVVQLPVELLVAHEVGSFRITHHCFIFQVVFLTAILVHIKGHNGFRLGSDSRL